MARAIACHFQDLGRTPTLLVGTRETLPRAPQFLSQGRRQRGSKGSGARHCSLAQPYGKPLGYAYVLSPKPAARLRHTAGLGLTGLDSPVTCDPEKLPGGFPSFANFGETRLNAGFATHWLPSKEHRSFYMRETLLQSAVAKEAERGTARCLTAFWASTALSFVLTADRFFYKKKEIAYVNGDFTRIKRFNRKYKSRA
ncbi:hypothetical protein [Mastigocladopsis repens]|uniref:hypothetical protein n=1 Tax=Mastigocladopsis repens TaxID=221287 RepID=UPI00052417FC|nr:hypothetical protein [Mastigocladopsis repens]